MKKLIALLLCLVAVLCLYACTPEEGTSGSSGTTAVPPQTTTRPTTVPPVTTTRPTVPKPTTQPTTVPTIPTEPPEPTTPPEPTVPPTEPHVHSFGPWILIQHATCTKPEVSTHICACNYTEQKITGQTVNHNYDHSGACVVCGRQVSAGLAYQLNDDGKSYTLISLHECQDEDIIIPEIYQGLPVTAIGYAAFSGGEMVSVEMPDSISSIADNAFQNCYRLERVKLPANLRTIGSWAFSGTALTELYIPENVSAIGREAFHHCESLRSISVDPYNVAFEERDGVLFNGDMTRLLVYPGGKEGESYLVPEGVTEIADYAFLSCFRLRQIQLPEGLVSIGEAAFAGTGIRAVSVPASVVTIGKFAFGADRESSLPGYGGCDYLAQIQVQENNPYYKSVDGVLFSKDGSRLLVYPAGKPGSSYTVPSGVTHIGDYAFVGCTRLAELILSEGVTTVGKNAFGAGFYKYNNLESITIPATVTQLGDYALAFCNKLTDIYYGGTSLQWIMMPKGHDWDLQSNGYTLHCWEPEPEPEPEPTEPDPSVPGTSTPEPSIPDVPTEPTEPTEPVEPTKPQNLISFRVRVVDQYGQPVPNVWVRIWRHVSYTLKTDADGYVILLASIAPFEDGYSYVPLYFDDYADEVLYEEMPNSRDPQYWYFFEEGSGEGVIVLIRK